MAHLDTRSTHSQENRVCLFVCVDILYVIYKDNKTQQDAGPLGVCKECKTQKGTNTYHADAQPHQRKTARFVESCTRERPRRQSEGGHTHVQIEHKTKAGLS